MDRGDLVIIQDKGSTISINDFQLAQRFTHVTSVQTTIEHYRHWGYQPIHQLGPLTVLHRGDDTPTISELYELIAELLND